MYCDTAPFFDEFNELLKTWYYYDQVDRLKLKEFLRRWRKIRKISCPGCNPDKCRFALPMNWGGDLGYTSLRDLIDGLKGTERTFLFGKTSMYSRLGGQDCLAVLTVVHKNSDVVISRGGGAFHAGKQVPGSSLPHR